MSMGQVDAIRSSSTHWRSRRAAVRVAGTRAARPTQRAIARQHSGDDAGRQVDAVRERKEHILWRVFGDGRVPPVHAVKEERCLQGARHVESDLSVVGSRQEVPESGQESSGRDRATVTQTVCELSSETTQRHVPFIVESEAARAASESARVRDGQRAGPSRRRQITARASPRHAVSTQAACSGQ